MLKKITILFSLLGAAFGLLLLTSSDSLFVVDTEITLEAPPELVWAKLADVDSWSQWWPGVEAARLEDTLTEGQVIHLQLAGRPETSPAFLVRLTRPLELVWERKTVLGSRAGTGFLLGPDPAGSRIKVENFIRGPQAVLARLTGREAFIKYQMELLKNLQVSLALPGEKD